MPTTLPRSRQWTFTLNNYDPENLPPFVPDSMKFLCYGEEVAPTTGTPHLQGYVVFLNPVAKPTRFLPNAYCQITRGSPQSNIDYCSKDSDGKFHRFGTPPMDQASKGEAEQRRWDNIYDNAVAGNFDEIPKRVRLLHGTKLKQLRQEMGETPRQLEQLENVWVYGSSGSGKSRWVRQEYGPDDRIYIKCPDNKWWDGYKPDKHETVLIDDLHPEWKGAYKLKNWADHYAFQAEVKGGTMLIRPKRIIITSNYKPEEIFSNSNDLEPIRRRFTVKVMNVHIFSGK